MNRFLTFIALACSLLVSSAPVFAAETYWSQHKSTAPMYEVDLAGAEPTATQISNNNIKAGTIIVDTSRDTAYLVVNPRVPLFVSFASNSTVAAVSVTMPANSIASSNLPTTISDSSFSNILGYVVISNFTLKNGGSFTLPVNAVGSTALPATIANSSFSNIVGYIVVSNVTVKDGGTLTLPAGSIGSAALPATIANSAFSNNTGLVKGSNFIMQAGGRLTMEGVTLPTSNVVIGVGLASTTTLYFVNGSFSNQVTLP